MSAAPQLCPHCRRPFKRLRSHLPHCRAAPGTAQGPAGTGAAATDRTGTGGTGLPPAEPKDGSAQAGTRGPGAGGKAPAGSARRERGRKATEPPVPPVPGAAGGGCSGPGDRGLRGREGKRGQAGAGAGQRAPVPAPHTDSLRVPGAEASGAHSERQTVPEPILSGAELQPLPHAARTHPVCLPQAAGGSTQAAGLGLEWFPDLHPNYDRLRVFPGKLFHEDVEITMRTPTGNFSMGQRGPLLERPLMDVRLGELPLWVTTRDCSPQALLGGAQRAWNSYYNKYINVKKGGPAGISMLLAGYCLLSYAWNYQHIKHYRWRKYH